MCQHYIRINVSNYIAVGEEKPAATSSAVNAGTSHFLPREEDRQIKSRVNSTKLRPALHSCEMINRAARTASQ